MGKRLVDGRKPGTGYGAGSRASQYVKGVSGHRDGRPRRKKPSTLEEMIANELQAKVHYQENGIRRKSTKLALMITQAANQAITGDLKPLMILLRIIDRLSSLALTPAPSLLDGIDLSSLSAVELSDLYRKAVTEEA